MHTVVLDRYTNKYFKVDNINEADMALLHTGAKIIYMTPDPKSWVLRSSIGTVMQDAPLPKDSQITGTYSRILQGAEKEIFEEKQKEALKAFPAFKQEFRAEYPGSIPITARYQIFSDQLYFFFYSEERYVFTEFVRRFREKVGKSMFLFQVGVRDMMRMSPGADGMCGPCGQPLCCKLNTVLPNVEIGALLLQHLEGRDIEKLKGKCWKLKCCLLYELDVYVQESKKFPHKGTKINTCKLTNHCKDKNCSAPECQGIVISFNIITQEVSIKTKDGVIRIPIEKLKS